MFDIMMKEKKWIDGYLYNLKGIHNEEIQAKLQKARIKTLDSKTSIRIIEENGKYYVYAHIQRLKR
jgi:hypothetical protein